MNGWMRRGSALEIQEEGKEEEDKASSNLQFVLPFLAHFLQPPSLRLGAASCRAPTMRFFGASQTG